MENPTPQVMGDHYPLVEIKKIMAKPIDILQDVISILPDITQWQKFHYIIKDYGFTCQTNGCNTRQTEFSLIAQYRPGQYGAPCVITFDHQQHDWVRTPIE